MIFAWFDTKAAKALGCDLAHSFIARVPVDTKLSDRKFEARAKAAVAALQLSVAEFKKAHRLNAYQKAQAGNSFKWVLKDAGYEATYVDKLTDLLMLQL